MNDGPKTPTVQCERLGIVGVDPELGFGGGETQVLGLTRELIRHGHRAELVCHPRGRLWEVATACGIVCHSLAVRNAVDFVAGVKLRTILAKQRYDVVHFHTARAHALAPFARGAAGTLVVTRRMDYSPGWLSVRLLYGSVVDAIIAISGGVAQALTDAGVPGARIDVIPSGVDIERFHPPSVTEREAARLRLGLSPDEIAIGALGALEERKGHRFLIEAISQVRTLGWRVRCFIAGSGSQQARLARVASALGLKSSVVLMGNIGDPLALLRALDIYALPSLKEGLGVALLEAMSCGLPSIGSSVGGVFDAIENSVTGLLVGAGDVDELVEAIKRLVREPDMAARLGAAARERVEKNFSVAAMGRRTLGLYRRCLDGSET